jgi:predicted PhzF superfamily epimerase YddE/YHI9
VTGSAHCSLGPYFGTKLGKKVVIGKQESERGGLVECILKQEEGRVCIVGTAVKTVSGLLSMPI